MEKPVGKTVREDQEQLLQQQRDQVLPLIEAERRTYIGNQYGRILCVLGQEYWDKQKEKTGVLWNQQERRPVEDPYELDIGTLSRLSELCRVIPHGTVRSYTFFYIMHDYERSRLQFLAGIQAQLEAGETCREEELAELTEGHEKFLTRWAEQDPAAPN